CAMPPPPRTTKAMAPFGSSLSQPALPATAVVAPEATSKSADKLNPAVYERAPGAGWGLSIPIPFGKLGRRCCAIHLPNSELDPDCTQLLPACLLEITRLDKAEPAHIEMPAQSGQNLIGGQGLDLFLQVHVEGHRPVRMKLQPEAAHQFRILG